MPVRFVSASFRARVLSGNEPPWLVNHPRRTYLIALYAATPPWISRKDILSLQLEAKCKELLTGVEHVMDHIIPLNHPLVCGLNVPWNIQLLTRAQNAAKSNVWYPDQMELQL